MTSRCNFLSGARLMVGVSAAISFGHVFAANQCITTAGTYGAVTITQSAGCTEPGFNPLNYEGMDGFGLGTDMDNTAGVACTIGFDHPIRTSSITIDMSGHNPGDDTSFTTSSGTYTPISADLDPTPLPTSPSATDPLAVSGNLIVTSGFGSGTFRFTNAPPETTTSLTINHASQGYGTFFRVCLDDADVSPPVLADDSFTVSRSAPTALDVLPNDEAGVTLDTSYALTLSNAAAGALAYSGGQIQFTPTGTFTAPATFQYQACNAASVCSIATVTLTPQAIAPSAPTPVPGLGAIGLLALTPMIGLAGIAGFSRRRKQ
ncbi:hypothetical protein M2375_000933 [Comamonas sp. BIGb0152]|uniref:Ig-like domain-containing protein n=1 Tax=Comamonas sp. BIGb0152 TaxID=2940601 RepID=UPI002167AD64|nr:Ig-like domain-containing protein [Comamonas sp. BIGb0152]MCS4292727.1 hypothetical protein [Comamonas sp. BIGb0152]